MASEFAQEFSTVLKGMEKERIAREKKAEDALIIFFTTTGSLAFIAIAIIIDCIL